MFETTFRCFEVCPRCEREGASITEYAYYDAEGRHRLTYREFHCSRCGVWWQDEHASCPTCGGEGVICVETAYYDAEFGQWLPDYREYPCPDCNGDWVDECDYAIEESVLGV